MVKITYIGKLSEALARVHTGTWQEILFKKGESKEVSEEVAEKLLRYPEQYTSGESKKSDKKKSPGMLLKEALKDVKLKEEDE